MRLFRVEVDNRGKPVLLKGEVERATLQNAELHFEGVSGVEGFLIDTKYSGGYALLTSYRLLWVPYDPATTTFDPAPCHLPLGAIADAALAKAFLSLKPARVKVNLRIDASRYPCSDPLAVAGNVKIRMVAEKERSSAVDTFFAALQAALGSAAWRRAPLGLIQEMHTPPPVGAGAAGRGGAGLGAGPMTPPPSLLKSLSASEGRGSQSLTPARSSQIFVDPAMLAQLRQMGYSDSLAAEALAATGNAGVEAAANWILDHPTPPQPAVSGPLGGAAAGFAPAGPFAAAAAEAAAATDTSVVLNPLLQAHRLSEPLNSVGSSIISASSSQQQQYRTPPPLQRSSLSGVGVGGALHREEKRAAATEKMLGEAFSDLHQLMAKAGEMVKLAEAFRARAARARTAGDDEDAQMDDALAEELADLGLASPITRESCGKQYYSELARQVAAVMEKEVSAAGGVLPLPEVYRKFSRARFTDLVSPDDLLQAVRRLPDVGAPLRVREYPSGVKALVAAGLNEEAALKAVVELAEHGTPERIAAAAEDDAKAPAPWEAALGPGVTRVEAATALGVPLPVAGEHLAAAEAAGLLCRDDGPEDIRFFKNFFFATAAA